ncbi:winged helix-turn-helix domain-containing protein [Aeromonas salmonicida]|uniref:winged helix-turn-helix domain-containing protein n=1 Tax=Aeromonas salmonicida TaxID=645 RepID=UPI003D20105F
MNEHDDVKVPVVESFLLDNSIIFDPMLSELSFNGKYIKLAYTESKTLQLLIQHAGEIVPREQITEFSWSGRIVTDSSLAKSISNIRKALRELGLNDDSIITIPRIGYRLTCSVLKVIEKNEKMSSSEDEIFIVPDENEQANEDAQGEEVNTVEKSTYADKAFISLRNISTSINIVIVFSSLIMLGLSLYNIFWRIDQDLNKVYLAKGYEIYSLEYFNKSYDVIKPERLVLTDDIKSIISIAPNRTPVFIKKKDDVYNLSFFIKGKGMSFTFAGSNRDVTVCRIKDIFSEGEGICGM